MEVCFPRVSRLWEYVIVNPHWVMIMDMEFLVVHRAAPGVIAFGRSTIGLRRGHRRRNSATKRYLDLM
jgi:hypothetical protein